MKSAHNRRSRRRALGHVRVSVVSRVQQQESLAQQQQVIAEFCAANEIDLIEVYVEEGRSAKYGERPALDQMTADATAKPKPVDLILVGEITRLFRDIEALRLYRNRLAEAGVDLLSVRRQSLDKLDDLSRLFARGQ